MRGLFVTGTDTGVGKSVLSAALLAAGTTAGLSMRAYKPVLTGLSEPAADWPTDDRLLAEASGMDPAEVAPLRFGPAVSPHLAAELAGEPIDPARLVAAASTGHQGNDAVIVEGVGGLMVPLAGDYLVRDLACELGLPLLIAARPGLGTINHSLLTLACARRAGLNVLAVVLTPWPELPDQIALSNRDTIGRLGEVDVETLATVAAPDRRALAAAGGSLPWRRWLA